MTNGPISIAKLRELADDDIMDLVEREEMYALLEALYLLNGIRHGAPVHRGTLDGFLDRFAFDEAADVESEKHA